MELEECPECHELFTEEELELHFLDAHPKPLPEKEDD